MNLKKISAAVLVVFACLLQACHVAGTAYDADDVKGYAEAFRIMQEQIDFNTTKVYYMKFETTQAMGNNLETVTVHMVNENNKCYSQKILLVANNEQQPREGIPTAFESPQYRETKGIDIPHMDPKSIIEQINKAKAQIPAGSKFKSVADYCITETVPAGNSDFNNGVEMGVQTTSFNLTFTQKTEDKSEAYAEVRVLVQDDGSVKFDID